MSLKKNIYTLILAFGMSFLYAQNSNVLALNTEPKIFFYPNPVRDNLNIKIQSEDFVKNIPPIIIVNVLGQEVLKVNPKQQKTINLTHLPKGIYFIRYRYANKQFTHKVVKN